jgi:endonuclease-3
MIEIKKRLNRLFPHPKVPLTHKSPYTLLIAVLLSARCTDARVNTVTPLLFAKADTPQKMAALSVAEIQAIIRPCGLSPQKAKAIRQLSQNLLDHHHGKVPKTFEELEKLPGVGHKTASVVLAQAFGRPAFPVDTHVFRLARRWGLSRGKTVKKVEEDLKKLLPEKEWAKTSLQIIFYGRKYCPARGHKIAACPICSTLKT